MVTDFFTATIIASAIITIAASAFIYRLFWVERMSLTGWLFANCATLVVILVDVLVCLACGFGATSAYIAFASMFALCQLSVAATWFISTIIWRRWCRRNPYRTPCGGYIERPY